MTRSPFVPPEILLLGPGPSPVPHEVLAAQTAPLLGHLDRDFLELRGRVQQDLREVFETGNRLTIPISGTGSAGMEAALVNLVEAGDRVVVGVIGVFGARLAEIARRLGADVVEVKVPFGQALDPAEMRKAIAAGPTRVVALVHAETSTGVLQPLPQILDAAEAAGAVTIVDCVTSLAGVPIAIDPLGIDCAYSGTQKCLGVPPGLAPITFGARALAKMQSRKSKPVSWYLDVGLIAAYWGTDRVYHHTAPISAIYGLAAGLRLVLAEGLAARHRRHRDVARALWEGLQVLGVELAVDESIRTPMVTSIRVPAGIDEAQVRWRLREVHRIEIGAGLGEWKGKVWRIGLLGHGARMESVFRVLASLAECLATQGRTCDGIAAVRAAAKVDGR
jgi:alanine-glyoxylate transaminase/serine-glyoxylate transaminase/serine-pyruvate transaminase